MGGRGKLGQGIGEVAVLIRVNRIGLIEKLTFEQRPEGGEGSGHSDDYLTKEQSRQREESVQRI